MVYAIGSFVWHIVQNAPNQGSASGARCAARWTIHPSQVPVLGEARWQGWVLPAAHRRNGAAPRV